MSKKAYIPSDNAVVNYLSRLIGLMNVIKRLQIRNLDGLVNNANCKSLLDVGCGSGYMSYYVSDAFNSVTGVDLKPNKSWPAISRRASNVEFYTFEEYIKKRTPCDVLLLSEVMGEMGNLSEFTSLYDYEFQTCREVILITSFGRRSVAEAIYAITKRFSRLLPVKIKHKDEFIKSVESKLSKKFSNNDLGFFQKNEYLLELEKYSLTLDKEIFDFSNASIFVFELIQILLSAIGLKPYGKRLMLIYPLIKTLNLIYRSRSHQYAVLHFTKG